MPPPITDRRCPTPRHLVSEHVLTTNIDLKLVEQSTTVGRRAHVSSDLRGRT
jgi:hypothetical protein